MHRFWCRRTLCIIALSTVYIYGVRRDTGLATGVATFEGTRVRLGQLVSRLDLETHKREDKFTCRRGLPFVCMRGDDIKEK